LGIRASKSVSLSETVHTTARARPPLRGSGTGILRTNPDSNCPISQMSSEWEWQGSLTLQRVLPQLPLSLDAMGLSKSSFSLIFLLPQLEWMCYRRCNELFRVSFQCKDRTTGRFRLLRLAAALAATGRRRDLTDIAMAELSIDLCLTSVSN